MSIDLIQLIERHAKLEVRRIGFGLSITDKVLLRSLRKASEYADIVLVGPPSLLSIRGFKVVYSNQPEEKLVQLLLDRQVDGVVRGTLDDLQFFEQYNRQLGKISPNLDPSNRLKRRSEKSAYGMGVAFIKDPEGRSYFLTPISNREGWRKEERCGAAILTAKMAMSLGIDPKIAVFSAVRHETYIRSRGKETTTFTDILNQTYNDGKWVVRNLTKLGFCAEHLSIDLDKSIKSSFNVLLPANGLVGNQIVRALWSCGANTLGMLRLGLPHYFEDNSRNELDFVPHIRFLVARINSGNI